MLSGIAPHFGSVIVEVDPQGKSTGQLRTQMQHILNEQKVDAFVVPGRYFKNPDPNTLRQKDYVLINSKPSADQSIIDAMKKSDLGRFISKIVPTGLRWVDESAIKKEKENENSKDKCCN